MTRSLRLLVALPALLLPTGGAAMVATSRGDHAPAYTVAQVRAHLVDDPAAWVGRTVRVRGVATKCFMLLEHGYFRCLPLRQPQLSDPDLEVASEPLLAWAAPDPLLAFVRRVPLLGGRLPAPQAVDWWEVATYRVGCGPSPTGRAVPAPATEQWCSAPRPEAGPPDLGSNGQVLCTRPYCRSKIGA
jgi:hypothetical protein